MKLSIIIPVYNTEEYIRQCIDSVMNIKNIETEIIAVNDGSTDRTKDILEEYTENHDRIKVITQENQGASAARNTGIKASTGDYIYFLDSDDWVDTVSFEKIIRQLEDDYKSGEKTDIVVGKEKAYSEFTKEEVLDERIPRQLIGKTVSGKEYMIKSIKGKFWNVRLPIYLYSRKLLMDNSIYFPTGRRSNEDEVFSIDVFYHAEKLKITDEIFGNYRARSGSIMSVLNITHAEDIFENAKELLERYRNEKDSETKEIIFYMIKRYYKSSMKKAVQCGRNDVFKKIYRQFRKDCRDYLFKVKSKKFENVELYILYYTGGVYYTGGNFLKKCRNKFKAKRG
jgi:glycosyltransferase